MLGYNSVTKMIDLFWAELHGFQEQWIRRLIYNTEIQKCKIVYN